VARALSAAIVIATLIQEASAQPTPQGSPSDKEMAKQLSNPVANIVSVPLQLKWDEGVGPNEDLRFVMNFQPVVPFTVNHRWNLIGRFIVPFIGQPPLVAGGPSSAGTGDIVMSAFVSPSAVRGVLWGVGPVIGLPTTTDPFLGSGKWSVGPTAVLLKQSGAITAGALVNHLWSIASTGKTERPDVNLTLLQPFFAYTTTKAVTFNVNTEATANWEAEEGSVWSVPLNVSVSKLTRFGPFPFSIGGGVGAFVASPEGGPDWKLRMTMTLILPRTR
jgi:hypothetical protein